MQFLRRISFSLLQVSSVAALLGLQSFFLSSNAAQAQSAVLAPAGSPVTYVSDFDLDVVVRKPAQQPTRRTTPTPTPGGAPGAATASSKAASSARSTASSSDVKEITPADRANALINDVSESLIRALREAGYQAQRLPADSPLPKVGLRLRGVFAEADERNRARRLLIGGEPVSPGILLYVGVNNLSRPEQPLYALADPPIPDPRHGPVITVTSYAPAIRFELSREPSDEELNKMSRQVAASLASLLNANRLSLAQ